MPGEKKRGGLRQNISCPVTRKRKKSCNGEGDPEAYCMSWKSNSKEEPESKKKKAATNGEKGAIKAISKEGRVERKEEASWGLVRPEKKEDRWTAGQPGTPIADSKPGVMKGQEARDPILRKKKREKM